MKKHREELPEETEEQKQARWAKQQKKARSMAKSCGIDIKKLARQRERMEREKAELRSSHAHY